MDIAIVRAWHTHDAELHELWGSATSALDRAGIRGKVVGDGFDDGGAGSSDCGAHIVLVLTTELRTGVVSGRLRHALFPVLSTRFDPLRERLAAQVAVVAVGTDGIGVTTLVHGGG